MPNANQIPDFSKIAREIKKRALWLAAQESVNFFKECFVIGGWTDNAFKKWVDRVSPLGGKKTLYRDGNLMASIRKTQQSDNSVTVGSDSAYSEIHNEGGEITVTEQMKKYWWAQYYKLAGKVKTTKGGKVSQSAANRKVSAKAEFCKRMALMKVGTKIKIPQRRFLGESRALMAELDKQAGEEMELIFKNNLNKV